MKRKEKLKKLIGSEIVNTKFIFSLDSIGIDANHFSIDISDVIFDIAKINKKKRNEKFYEDYFNLIKKGISIDLRIEENKLAELINEVIVFLKHSTCGEYVGKQKTHLTD